MSAKKKNVSGLWEMPDRKWSDKTEADVDEMDERTPAP
jgi:hypothetical protein